MHRPAPLTLAVLLAIGLGPVLGCVSLQAARLAQQGSAAIDRGDSASAIADLERAVALEPTAAPLVNNLGVAYLAGGRRADALRAFERAVALDCSHEPAQQNLRALRAPTGTPAEPGSVAVGP